MKIRSVLICVLIVCSFCKGYSTPKNYLNSKFALISPDYERHCLPCKEISDALFKLLKEEKRIFNRTDRYPNWIVAKDKNTINSSYRGIDFFLTSTITPKSTGYKIIFKLIDKNDKPYPSQRFIQEISKAQLLIDLENIAEIVISELTDFKSKGHFKKIFIVEDLEIIDNETLFAQWNNLFSDWLTSELKKHKTLNADYHFYYYKNIDFEAKILLDGFIRQIAPKEGLVRIKIAFTGIDDLDERFKLTLDLYNYDSVNKKEILHEIQKTIEKLER